MPTNISLWAAGLRIFCLLDSDTCSAVALRGFWAAFVRCAEVANTRFTRRIAAFQIPECAMLWGRISSVGSRTLPPSRLLARLRSLWFNFRLASQPLLLPFHHYSSPGWLKRWVSPKHLHLVN